MTAQQLKDLKELSMRLKERGFSWQYSDYLLLKLVLPEIILKEEQRKDGCTTG